MQYLIASLVLAVASTTATAAVCTNPHQDLGTISPDAPGTFGSGCHMVMADWTDPAAWTFANTIDFTLAEPGRIWGRVHTFYTPAHQVDPDAEWKAEPYFGFRDQNIYLLVGGNRQLVGGRGPGYDAGSFFAVEHLEAGDHTLVFAGELFNRGARAGFYSGELVLSPATVAAPVPEPEAIVLLALGAPLALWGARRRTSRLAALPGS